MTGFSSVLSQAVQEGDESIRFIGKFILTGASHECASTLFREWYQHKAKEKLVPRIHYFARNI